MRKSWSDKQAKGKYGALIQKARKEENQNAGLPESQETGEAIPTAAIREKEVNLSIKMPQSLRRHWAAESKRLGVSMTSVIIQALTEKFGTPPN